MINDTPYSKKDTDNRIVINEPELIMSPEYYESMKPELDKLFEPVTINSQTKGKQLYDKLEALADNYNMPSITEWKQGRFIDSSKYARMSGEWKDEQDARERTLIRPYGGTNNALFQISGNENIAGIAEYLEAVGKLLKEECEHD